MSLKYHPTDKRVICVDKANDFALFKKDGVEGIICNYPANTDLDKAVYHYATCAINSPEDSEVFRHIDKFKIVSSLFHIDVTEPPLENYDLTDKSLKTIREEFNAASIKEPLQQAIMHMAHCFTHATGIKQTVTEIRLNSSFPSEFHTHNPTVVMTLLGNGTYARNLENDVYEVERGQIFLIGKNLEHRAPEPISNVPIYRVALLTF